MMQARSTEGVEPVSSAKAISTIAWTVVRSHPPLPMSRIISVRSSPTCIPETAMTWLRPEVRKASRSGSDRPLRSPVTMARTKPAASAGTVSDRRAPSARAAIFGQKRNGILSGRDTLPTLPEPISRIPLA